MRKTPRLGPASTCLLAIRHVIFGGLATMNHLCISTSWILPVYIPLLKPFKILSLRNRNRSVNKWLLLKLRLIFIENNKGCFFLGHLFQ